MNYLKSFMKIAASLCLLYLLFRKVDFSQAGSWLFSWAGIEAVLAAALIFTLQSLVAAYRTRVVLQLFAEACPLFTGFRIWVTGLFFGQTLISFIAGDAIRVWQLTKLNIPVNKATLSIVFDRIIGSIVLIVMFLTVLPFAFNLIVEPILQKGLLALLAVSCGAIFIFFALGLLKFKNVHNKFLQKIIEITAISQYFWQSKQLTGKIVFFSFIMHACNVMVLFIAMRILGMDIDFMWCWILTQPIMLLTLMPISFAGWGVREGAMIVGFGLLGFAADKILAVSVAFGIGLMLASLPGLFFFMQDRKSKNAAILAKPLTVEESLAK